MKITYYANFRTANSYFSYWGVGTTVQTWHLTQIWPPLLFPPLITTTDGLYMTVHDQLILFSMSETKNSNLFQSFSDWRRSKTPVEDISTQGSQRSKEEGGWVGA